MFKTHQLDIQKDAILELEIDILLTLDFEVRFVPAHRFLERYQRLFELDSEKTEKLSRTVGIRARNFLRYMLLSAKFTSFRPSQ